MFVQTFHGLELGRNEGLAMSSPKSAHLITSYSTVIPLEAKCSGDFSCPSLRMTACHV